MRPVQLSDFSQAKTFLGEHFFYISVMQCFLFSNYGLHAYFSYKGYLILIETFFSCFFSFLENEFYGIFIRYLMLFLLEMAVSVLLQPTNMGVVSPYVWFEKVRENS